MKITYENITDKISLTKARGLSRMIHIHKELELIYVRKGRAVAYADTNSYLLNPGDMFLVFPNQVHYYEIKESGDFAIIIFSSDTVYGLSDVLLNSAPDTNLIPYNKDDNFPLIFDRIYSLSNKYGNLALNGYINVILSMVLPRMELKTVNVESNTALYGVIDYCTKNFRENITLDDLADKLHLSKYYISHMINKKLNRGFNEYLNNLRICEACNLLKETDTKIADISEEVGFGTIRSFNRSFKTIIGISPADYREKNAALKKST
ncbi:MAG: AraC family transcriptional regulator [Acutalibacteraceae bacterium]|nr:AraC family transcriptional regulator [Acutalibacteraceae bacterium]